MKNALKIASGVIGGSGGGVALPYTFDPSALGDGALPSPWEHTTYTISSGKIVNTPTLESELLAVS